jgi:hypothetical protein
MVKKKTGGKVIASGGFGCVFKPALKCKGQTIREKNKITKLMLKKYATEEYNDVMKYETIFKKISNYNKYFLVDGFHLCYPSSLNEQDIENFKKKCSALPKKDINKDNINNSLDKLLALNMPDGGLPIDDFVDNSGSYSTIIDLNNSLVDLLENGIIQMNNHYIFHCDIKDSNILVEKNITDNKIITRLIDWGLSTRYIPFKNDEFPKSWKNRPFQFNTPFSVIIFSDKFIEKYTNFIELNKNVNKTSKIINEVSLKEFIVDFIYYWIKERGTGHFKFINSIMYKLFFNHLKNTSDSEKENNNKLVEIKYTIPYITNYIYIILLNYTRFTDNGQVTFRHYLDEVFIKIVDIYGLISSYYPILQIYYENYNILSVNEMKIFNKIKEIFLVYLYEPIIKPIDLKKLISDFKSLNPLFQEEEKIKFKTLNVLTLTLNKTKRNKSTSTTKSSSSKTRKNKEG